MTTLHQTPDKKDGLTAREAVQLLFPEPEPDPQSLTDDPLYAGGVTWVDREYDEWGGNFPPPEFLGLLKRGSWYAMGYLMLLKPDSRRKSIPPHLWDVLALDLDNNSASGGGLEYESLRFYEKRAESTKTILPRTECCKWLLDEMKAPKSRTKTDYEAEARDGRFPGLSERAFRVAWDDARKEPTTHTSWLKPGPVGSS